MGLLSEWGRAAGHVSSLHYLFSQAEGPPDGQGGGQGPLS